jgi:ATP-dependent RNA helicase DeaD
MHAHEPQLEPSSSSEPSSGFHKLGLDPRLLGALLKKGYSDPTPIQGLTIPVLLKGRDMVGQAQTGTGKTAAFALPLLQRMDVNNRMVQALILAPTRELALQVTEAIESYATQIGQLRVLTVYGGAPIFRQLKELRRGVQIVVGTPGRIRDCMERGALDISEVKNVVLDEADEMLRMGFIEEVEWILAHTPEHRQTALFSATMPPAIKRVAQKYLRNPEHIAVETKVKTADMIEQRCMVIPHRQKLDALARLLEAEPTEAVLIFARTKVGCNELMENLQRRGFSAAALHGDMNQSQREKVVRQIKDGRTKIVVATDVAARGLDVNCITHVVNYDIPTSPEVYVHRIGRTGRAGRKGVSILLATPKERRVLSGIERFTGKVMTPMSLPSNEDVALNRASSLKARVAKELAGTDLGPYKSLIEEMLVERDVPPLVLAAALARLAAGDKPLVLKSPEPIAPISRKGGDDSHMINLFLSVGFDAGVRPGNIVAAVTNEAGVPPKAIGAIDIRKSSTIFAIDKKYAEVVLKRLSKVAIRGRFAAIREARPESAAESPQYKAPRSKGGPARGSSRPGGPRRSGGGFRSAHGSKGPKRIGSSGTREHRRPYRPSKKSS